MPLCAADKDFPYSWLVQKWVWSKDHECHKDFLRGAHRITLTAAEECRMDPQILEVLAGPVKSQSQTSAYNLTPYGFVFPLGTQNIFSCPFSNCKLFG